MPDYMIVKRDIHDNVDLKLLITLDLIKKITFFQSNLQIQNFHEFAVGRVNKTK